MASNPDASVASVDGLSETIRKLEQERDASLKEASCMRDQLEVLAQATKSLSQLVSSTLATDLSALSATNDQGKLATSSNVATIDRVQKEERPLDDLLQDAKLKDTGFLDLGKGCKRLCENLRLIAIEADDALSEMQAANKSYKEAKEKLKTTGKALSKLYKENEALKKENLKMKKDRKRVAREVSEYVDDLKNETDRKLDEAYALMAHEKALSTPANATKVDMISDDESTALLSYPSPSTATCMSTSTSTSLVTDGGSATLRFRACTEDDISTLSALEGREASKDDDDDPFKGENDGPKSVGDFMGMLMNSKEVDRKVYHIEFSSSHIGLRMRAIPNRAKAGKGVDSTEPSTEKPSNLSFLVCGFRDYDLSLKKRPELGARLVAVDNTSVEYGEWTLKKVCDKIRSRKEGVCLSFRNDKLSKGDIARLNKILEPKKRALDDELAEVEPQDIKLPLLDHF